MSATPRPASFDPAALVARVRRRWRLRTLVDGAARAAAVTVGAAGVLIAVDALVGLPPVVRPVALWAVAAVAAALLAAAARRAAAAPTPGRVALLVDEASGTGALFSTVLASNAGVPVAAALRARAAHRLGGLSPAGVVPWRRGVVVGPLAALGAAAVVVAAAGGPDTVRARWSGDGAVSGRAGAAGTPAGPGARGTLPRLGAVDVRVVPPAYAGLGPRELATGDPVEALPGSVVALAGAGPATSEALRVEVVGGEALRAAVAPDGAWRASWTVGPEHRGVALAVAAGDSLLERRVLPLRLLRDRPPSVDLVAPDEDMVLGSPTGEIVLEARARDDLGVADLVLHWVRSRGSGESFDFEEGTWAWDRVEDGDGTRVGILRLRLDDLDLGAGDVLHVRARAVDRNDVTGPGTGVSATRQIRIARDDEMGEVTTLVGFPIEREREPVLSQRMIILLTEELLERQASVDASERMDGALDIAGEQARLRGRIGEQIFTRATGAMQDPEAHLDFEDGEPEAFLDALEGQVARGPLIDPETGMATISSVSIPAHEHDSDPIVAVNRSLLTVYDLMWEAERELRVADLEASLVPQYAALEELQRVREADRVFARGRVTVPPVDVSGTRGTGELDEVDPAARSGAAAAGGPALDEVARIDELLARRGLVGRSASLLLSGLSVDLLSLDGGLEAGAAVSRAADAAEADDEDGVRAALRAARRALLAVGGRTGPAAPPGPTSPLAAAWEVEGAAREAGGDRASASGDAPTSAAGAVGPRRPFVFATARYESGDWDSAPLVPANLIHSLARYTDLPVAPEGVVVDLAGAEALSYPFLYLTGHLPVFFSEAESRTLVDFVRRGGLLFVDDHNHDIDGAFHRSVTAELERLFGSGALRPLPNDHELYRAFFTFDDGPPITGHELSGWGDGLIHRELFHIPVDGRIGVLYSNKDYSSEWSYHAENKRFLAVDNTRFGVNLLVYALTR